jgi:hypothetical protein
MAGAHGGRMILPAIGALTGGMDATDPAILSAMQPATEIEALVPSGGSAGALPALAPAGTSRGMTAWSALATLAGALRLGRGVRLCRSYAGFFALSAADAGPELAAFGAALGEECRLLRHDLPARLARPARR